MDTMLDLNDIVVFARVIEAGSFTATVSRRIGRASGFVCFSARRAASM